MKLLKALLIAGIIFPAMPANAVTAKSISFTAEVWADNWFALYVNGKKVGEDSVPITTQKSFNSETIKFTATYPLTLGVIAKDYIQSPSGLEYLGTPNQQIGDGGIILQIRETISKKLVAVTDGSWKVLVQNIAPLNPDCEKSSAPDLDCKFKLNPVPATWASPTFKDAAWGSATVYTATEVSPKDGYSNILWSTAAKFIWGNDLKLDNTIYLRKKITSSNVVSTSSQLTLNLPGTDNGNLKIDQTCDGKSLSPAISWGNVPAAAKSLILIMDTIPGPLRPGETESGNHFYITQFNLSPKINGFAEGEITPYSPPCSQGPGVKEYRFFIYVLDKTLPTSIKYTGTQLAEIGERESIAKAMRTYTYARKA